MKTKELIESVLKGIGDDIVKDQQTKQLKASGKSAASLKAEADEGEGTLKGSSYLHFTITGRKPGPFKDGVKTMLAWIKQRGITPKDKSTSLESLAFLFARKISQRGNDIFLGKRPGLDVKNIISRWKKILVERFKANLIADIKNGTVSNK